MIKTPRQFRNELYQYLVDNNVTEDTASRIAGEAELFATAFEVYQLQDIEVAARKMGFKPGGESSE